MEISAGDRASFLERVAKVMDQLTTFGMECQNPAQMQAVITMLESLVEVTQDEKVKWP